MNIKHIPGSLIIALLLISACVKDREYEVPELDCVSVDQANTTIADVKMLFRGETLRIEQDLVLSGVVVSSDKAGNFFGSLHFQDRAKSPTSGIQLELDVRDSHLFFPPGANVMIKLKGLYLGKSAGVFKLGGAFSVFANLSVGRLPAAAVYNHVFSACGSSEGPEPTEVQIEGLNEGMYNTLVQFTGLEFSGDELDLPYAPEQEEGLRVLTDCDGNTIIMLNSGYSDFHSIPVPGGHGSITGVLHGDRDGYHLIVRDTSDVQFNNRRCTGNGEVRSSNKLFISELADPDNNSGARFMELFYAGEQELSLEGWSLRRYTNSSGEISSSLDLSSSTISPLSTLVIAANSAVFETTYGFLPDVEGGRNGPADSNGDDNLELVDPFGLVVDVFGIAGEDGSATNHEFEDGRAVRKPFVVQGNPQYTFSEWMVFNDTGQAGTTKLPQNAPGDFNPGSHDR